MRGYGNTVEVQHRDGYMTLYGHLHGFANIKLGQYVRQGQLIAYMGNTGRSTGPHLHFGVKHNGRWVNPKSIKGSVKIELHGKEKQQFLAYTKKIDEEMDKKVASK
jgi:murein DD-endopeptidase MepM/ murein hydrolase activator NlpD